MPTKGCGAGRYCPRSRSSTEAEAKPSGGRPIEAWYFMMAERDFATQPAVGLADVESARARSCCNS